MDLIRLKNVNKKYKNGVTAIYDMTLSLKKGSFTFVIGGSLGLSKEVIKRANYRWKLSSLTFLHTMTRLLVCEQIYRAMKINHHETYHK